MKIGNVTQFRFEIILLKERNTFIIVPSKCLDDVNSFINFELHFFMHSFPCNFSPLCTAFYAKTTNFYDYLLCTKWKPIVFTLQSIYVIWFLFLLYCAREVSTFREWSSSIQFWNGIFNNEWIWTKQCFKSTFYLHLSGSFRLCMLNNNGSTLAPG